MDGQSGSGQRTIQGRKARNNSRAMTKIDIHNAHKRWTTVMEENKIGSHERLALFLLDVYDARPVGLNEIPGNYGVRGHVPGCKGHSSVTSLQELYHLETLSLRADGSLDVCLKVTTSEPQCVSLLLNGQHVQGSPFQHCQANLDNESRTHTENGTDAAAVEIKQEPSEVSGNSQNFGDPTVDTYVRVKGGEGDSEQSSPVADCNSDELNCPGEFSKEEVSLDEHGLMKALYSPEENVFDCKPDARSDLFLDKSKSLLSNANTDISLHLTAHEGSNSEDDRSPDIADNEVQDQDAELISIKDLEMDSFEGETAFIDSDSEVSEEELPAKKTSRKVEEDPDFEPTAKPQRKAVKRRAKHILNISSPVVESEIARPQAQPEIVDDPKTTEEIVGRKRRKTTGTRKKRVKRTKAEIEIRKQAEKKLERKPMLTCPKSKHCSKFTKNVNTQQLHIRAHEFLDEYFGSKKRMEEEEEERRCDEDCFVDSADQSRDDDLDHYSRLIDESYDSGQIVCPVNGCTRTLVGAAKFDIHLAELHSGARCFVCPVETCGKCFSIKHKMNRHVLLRHATYEGDNYTCETCGKVFKTKLHLSIHVPIHNDGRRIYVCPVPGCGSDFAVKRYLRQHQKTHRTEFNYLCQICGKSYKRSECLRAHLLSQAHKQREADQMGQVPEAQRQTRKRNKGNSQGKCSTKAQ